MVIIEINSVPNEVGIEPINEFAANDTIVRFLRFPSTWNISVLKVVRIIIVVFKQYTDRE